MKNGNVKVGEEILSYCGKCKLALAHVIINMKDETTIGKCECKTCSAKHNYRDPETAGKDKTEKTASKPRTSSAEELWKEAMSKAKREPKPYAMDGIFKEGDVIDHPTFGKGVVEQRVMGNKIQTLFEQGSKLLICART